MAGTDEVNDYLDEVTSLTPGGITELPSSPATPQPPVDMPAAVERIEQMAAEVQASLPETNP